MAEKYVPIFFDWIEATQELNDQEKGRLIDAVVLYARGGDWQDRIKGNERYAFPVFRLQVDRAKNISSIRAAARTNDNKTEQKEQTATKRLTNTNTKTITNTRTNTNTNTKESEKRTRFTAPTVDEVEAYAKEKGYTISAQRFVDYYASKGWVVGKSPMKDWRAALRNWVSRDNEPRQIAPKDNPAHNYEQREYKDEDYGDDFFIDLDQYGEA